MTLPLQPHRTDRRDSAGADRKWLGDLHDAAARWRAADSTILPAAAELGNVVQFARPRRDGPARAAPEIAIAAATRPLAALVKGRPARWLLLLAGSFALHAALYLPFQRDPAPMSSIGLETISVEIVLGANEDAGLSRDTGSSSASAPTPSQSPKPTLDPELLRKIPTEVAKLTAPTDATVERPSEVSERTPTEVRTQTPAEAKPQETPVREAEAQPTQTQVTAKPTEETQSETPAAVKPVVPVQPKQGPAEAASVQAVPETTTSTEAELHVNPNPTTVTALEVAPLPEPRPAPTQPPREVTAQTQPKPKAAQKVERRQTRREARQAARQGEANRSTSTAPAATAAGGVGRGSSAANTNYRGLVAAHLARFKQFPAEARGSQGVATVTFALSGSGSLSSVRLVRGTGVSALDREAIAMVRRASPFPAPPDGRGTSFTVPLSFRQQ